MILWINWAWAIRSWYCTVDLQPESYTGQNFQFLQCLFLKGAKLTGPDSNYLRAQIKVVHPQEILNGLNWRWWLICENKYHVCRRWHKNLQSLAFIIINNRQGNSTHSQSSPGKPLNKDRALRNFVALSFTEAFALEWIIGASDSIIYSNILIEANVVHYMYTIYH